MSSCFSISKFYIRQATYLLMQISYSFQSLIYLCKECSRINLLTPVILNTTLFFAKRQGHYLDKIIKTKLSK
nr:MAG TPA: hypothetical protein [Bacteriophage sp.]